MSKEYPPRPTEMCEPVINGTNVVSYICDYFINKLKKTINDYWQSKYPKFTKGRIKRMRTRRESRYVRLNKRLGKMAYTFNSDFCSNLTRWTRH